MSVQRSALIAFGLTALLWGTGVAQEASGEYGQVWAVLEAWRQGVTNQDLEALEGLCVGDFRFFPWAGAPPHQGVAAMMEVFKAPSPGAAHTIAEVQIRIKDNAAVAEPVYTTTPYDARTWHFMLRKSDGAWRIAEIACLGGTPIELGLPGLGADYIELVEQWAGACLSWAGNTLDANPPNSGDTFLRAQALLMLDEPLHLRSAPELRCVEQFLRSRIDKAIEQMHAESVEEGLTLWKLYNHGWVVKTAHHAWAHDLYEGSGRASISEAQIDAILAQVEALFCSHWHGDQTSIPVLKRALALKKPVFVSPWPEGDWGAQLEAALFGELKDADARRGITVVEPGSSDEAAPGLVFRAHPGHQGRFVNIVFAVFADSLCVVQTGDQFSEEDFAWIDKAAEDRAVDVLLPNVWTLDLRRMIRGFRPRVVVPGHENELGHAFEHREPYDQAYELLNEESTERHVMAWGERLHVKGDKGP